MLLPARKIRETRAQANITGIVGAQNLGPRSAAGDVLHATRYPNAAAQSAWMSAIVLRRW